jgi:hypothetical protein
LRAGFLNVEGLRNKLVTKDFLGLLGCHDIFGTAESRLGLEVCDIKVYTSHLKGRRKIAKYGRDLGGPVVYITQDINKSYRSFVKYERSDTDRNEKKRQYTVGGMFGFCL